MKNKPNDFRFFLFEESPTKGVICLHPMNLHFSFQTLKKSKSGASAKISQFDELVKNR